MVRRSFDVLGIEVTKDTKQIKKAYAALARQYHPEDHPAEWARIHEAYETAIAYAEGRHQEYMRRQEEWRSGSEKADDVGDESRQEAEDEVLAVRDLEVVEDAEYRAVFQEAQTRWIREKTERAQKLQVRLGELRKLAEKDAVKEWQYFFANEFGPDEGTESLMLLLEVLREYPLPGKVLQMILTVMKDRSNHYNSAERADCEYLADEAVRCCRNQLTAYQRGRRKPVKGLWILVVLAVCTCAAGIARRHVGHVNISDVSKETAAYLNGKYGEGQYTAGELKAEKVTLPVNEEDRIVSYEIRTEESGEVVAYAVQYLEAEDHTFEIFDNIQAEEIRQAFEARLNELTGHTEGKLFWNSGTNGSMPGGIGNELFQTRYEGDFDAFIAKETEVRRRAPKGIDWSVASASRPINGICDYYLQDSKVQTMREKFEGQEFPEDAGLQEIFEGCAADYQVQLQSIVLPGDYFEEKMRQAAWDDTGMLAWEDTGVGYGLEPSVPFLMLTGWYVNLPPEEEKLLEIRNGMYTRKTVSMGNGIYGAESSVHTYPLGLEPEWTYGSIEKIETPAYLGLTKDRRKKAVSFQLTPGAVLSNDCCLAIDKEAYGIADAGYQVFISERNGDGADIGEASVSEYGETGRKLKNGDVLDGEGFVFLEYPAVESGDSAKIVTIVNP